MWMWYASGGLGRGRRRRRRRRRTDRAGERERVGRREGEEVVGWGWKRGRWRDKGIEGQRENERTNERFLLFVVINEGNGICTILFYIQLSGKKKKKKKRLRAGRRERGGGRERERGGEGGREIKSEAREGGGVGVGRGEGGRTVEAFEEEMRLKHTL